MLDYIAAMALIGGLCGVIVSLVFLGETVDSGESPRKIIIGLLLTILTCVIGAILLPALLLIGAVYLIGSFIKNDWGWYKR